MYKYAKQIPLLAAIDVMQNVGAIPIESMALWAACFVKVVFSGCLRIFLAK